MGVNIPIQNSLKKVGLKNPTAQLSVELLSFYLCCIIFSLWYEKFILVLGKNNPSNETMLSNADLTSK